MAQASRPLLSSGATARAHTVPGVGLSLTMDHLSAMLGTENHKFFDPQVFFGCPLEPMSRSLRPLAPWRSPCQSGCSPCPCRAVSPAARGGPEPVVGMCRSACRDRFAADISEISANRRGRASASLSFSFAHRGRHRHMHMHIRMCIRPHMHLRMHGLACIAMCV